QVGHWSVDPTQPSFAIHPDGGEWLIQLVSDRGGQLAQRRDPCGMSEVRLHALKHLLCSYSLSQVDQAYESAPQPIGRLRACDGVQHINDPPIKRRKPRRFLEKLFAPKSAFDGPPESVRAFAPDPVSRTEQLALISGTEHSHGVVVCLLNDR